VTPKQLARTIRGWTTEAGRVAIVTEDIPALAQRQQLDLLTRVAALALDRASSADALVRRTEEVATLQRVATEILTLHDPEQVLLSVNDHLLRMLDADIAGVLLIEGDELVMRCVTGHRLVDTARLRMRRGQGLAGRVFSTGQPHKVDDYVSDNTISRDFMTLAVREETRSAAGVPLRWRGEVTGVIEVWRRRPSVFTADDLALMDTLAGLVSIAIENARLYDGQSATLARLESAQSSLETQLDVLHRSAILQRRLSELVVERRSLSDIARAVSLEVGCGVVITLFHSGETFVEPPDLEVPDLSELRRTGHGHAAESGAPGPMLTTTADGGTYWHQLVWADGESPGLVVLIGGDGSRASLEVACGQTAMACSLHYIEALAESRARAEAVDELIWDLMTGSSDHRRAALARAHRMHLGVDGEWRVVYGVVENLERLAMDEGWNAAHVDAVRRQLSSAVRDAATGRGCEMANMRGDWIVILDSAALGRCEATIEALDTRIAKIHGRIDMSWGVSSVSADPLGLATAYEQAKVAATAARRLGAPRPLAYEQLGVMRLLATSGSGPDIDQFVSETIGPLIDYDRRKGGSLIQTLLGFFDADCSHKEAAAALYVHPKTLRYRLDRIRALTGLDLGSHDGRMRADLALRIHCVLANPTEPREQ
jgi:sugar diacid utilization regulator/putative methionine-R-sulfoxide reductase with GAF domain